MGSSIFFLKTEEAPESSLPLLLWMRGPRKGREREGRKVRESGID